MPQSFSPSIQTKLECSKAQSWPDRVELSWSRRHDSDPVLPAITGFGLPFIVIVWALMGNSSLLTGSLSPGLLVLLGTTMVYLILVYGAFVYFYNRTIWIFESDKISTWVGPLPWKKHDFPTFSPDGCTQVRLVTFNRKSSIRGEGYVYYRTHDIFLEGADLCYKLYHTRKDRCAFDLVRSLKEVYGISIVHDIDKHDE